MKKEFIRILLDSCDKKRLVNSLVEMINDEDQLAWIMGMIPHMDKQFVANHYSNLLTTAERKFNEQKGSDNMEKIVGKVFASNNPWDFPYVKFVVKREVFVLASAKEQCDAVSVKIEEYLAGNNNPSFDELEKLMDKYPYCQKKNAGDENYCSQITYYSFNTISLYADDISHIVEE